MIIISMMGCEKDTTVPVENVTGTQGAGKELIVDVKYWVQSTGSEVEPLPDVEIRLYGEHENFIIEMNEDKRQLSDSNGIVSFKTMTSGNYYVIGTHAFYGRIVDSVTIPPAAVKSYLELVYF